MFFIDAFSEQNQQEKQRNWFKWKSNRPAIVENSGNIFCGAHFCQENYFCQENSDGADGLEMCAQICLEYEFAWNINLMDWKSTPLNKFAQNIFRSFESVWSLKIGWIEDSDSQIQG